MKKRHLSSTVYFVIIALVAGLGYVAGTYHYQIEAAIGPVFGYRAHSGQIDLTSLQQTYNQLVANYDGKLDAAKLIQGANRGLVEAAGDDYTIYMSADESADYMKSLEGNIGGGIGAQISIRNDKVTIIRALKGNPAEKAGLTAGDVVLSINDQPTGGWTVDQAVSKIRGEEGTTVKLTIRRGVVTNDYTITRAIVNNPSVDSEVVGSIGILTITRFDDQTGDLARNAARDFKNRGVKVVILDLRDNGGGYVDAARDVAGLWLNNKVVVTERSGGAVKSTINTGNEAILNSIPTVVLVNTNSASASEIVAGALQDYGIAKLVGEKTFGKGSVQQLVQLDGGAQLKVTIARWYTPNGKNITKDGIKPNYVVGLSQKDLDAGLDPQLDKAKSLFNL